MPPLFIAAAAADYACCVFLMSFAAIDAASALMMLMRAIFSLPRRFTLSLAFEFFFFHALMLSLIFLRFSSFSFRHIDADYDCATSFRAHHDAAAAFSLFSFSIIADYDALSDYDDAADAARYSAMILLLMPRAYALLKMLFMLPYCCFDITTRDIFHITQEEPFSPCRDIAAIDALCWLMRFAPYARHMPIFDMLKASRAATCLFRYALRMPPIYRYFHAAAVDYCCRPMFRCAAIHYAARCWLKGHFAVVTFFFYADTLRWVLIIDAVISWCIFVITATSIIDWWLLPAIITTPCHMLSPCWLLLSFARAYTPFHYAVIAWCRWYFDAALLPQSLLLMPLHLRHYCRFTGAPRRMMRADVMLLLPRWHAIIDIRWCRCCRLRALVRHARCRRVSLALPNICRRQFLIRHAAVTLRPAFAYLFRHCADVYFATPRFALYMSAAVYAAAVRRCAPYAFSAPLMPPANTDDARDAARHGFIMIRHVFATLICHTIIQSAYCYAYAMPRSYDMMLRCRCRWYARFLHAIAADYFHYYLIAMPRLCRRRCYRYDTPSDGALISTVTSFSTPLLISAHAMLLHYVISMRAITSVLPRYARSICFSYAILIYAIATTLICSLPCRLLPPLSFRQRLASPFAGYWLMTYATIIYYAADIFSLRQRHYILPLICCHYAPRHAYAWFYARWRKPAYVAIFLWALLILLYDASDADTSAEALMLMLMMPMAARLRHAIFTRCHY